MPGEPTPHPVGYVPFHFVNARDVDDDFISDSPFEDVAILSRVLTIRFCLILKKCSQAARLRHCFSLYLNKDELPAEIKKKGLSDSPLVGFNGSMSQAPFLPGQSLKKITPYKEARNMLALNIPQSRNGHRPRQKLRSKRRGVSKEFEKTEALLIGMSTALGECEEFIIRAASKWDGSNIAEDAVEVEYSKSFRATT